MERIRHRRERHVPRILIAQRLLAALGRIEPTIGAQVRPHRRIGDDDVVKEDEAAEVQHKVTDIRCRGATNTETHRPLLLHGDYDAIETFNRIHTVRHTQCEFSRRHFRNKGGSNRRVAEKGSHFKLRPLVILDISRNRLFARQHFNHEVVGFTRISRPSVDRIEVNRADAIRVTRRRNGCADQIPHYKMHR